MNYISDVYAKIIWQRCLWFFIVDDVMLYYNLCTNISNILFVNGQILLCTIFFSTCGSEFEFMEVVQSDTNLKLLIINPNLVWKFY